MKDILYYLKNSFAMLFRYFKYDRGGQKSIIISLVVVAFIIMFFGGLILTFIGYSMIAVILLLPYLLARTTGKSDRVRTIIGVSIGLAAALGFIFHWSITFIVWLVVLIYSVLPEKINNIPEGGFF